MEGGELGVAVRPVGEVDLQAPGQVGGSPEQLLVEVVAEPADHLGQQQAGGQRVRQRPQQHPVPVAVEPGSEHSAGDRAPDAEAAVPDLQGTERVAAGAEVEVVVGRHVPDPGSDQPGGNRPEGDVADLARTPTTRDPALLAEPHRGDHAQDDGQRVGADRHRAEVPDTLRRAGNRQGDGQGDREQGHASASRIFSRSAAMSDGEVPAVQTRSPSAPWTATTLAVWSTS